jgi:hypothetical protein
MGFFNLQWCIVNDEQVKLSHQIYQLKYDVRQLNTMST